MADLSGHDIDNSNWTSLEDSPSTLIEILKEFGRMYVPALLANANAIMQGEETWETEIDGSIWKQKAFPYQAKCFMWTNERYRALVDTDRASVDSLLQGTGVETMLSLT